MKLVLYDMINVAYYFDYFKTTVLNELVGFKNFMLNEIWAAKL